MKKEIEKFLAQFPKDATSWAKATDEVRELSYESRIILEELDGVKVEPVNFRAFSTPAEWNTQGRDSIMANYNRMRTDTKRAFFERFRALFFEEE